MTQMPGDLHPPAASHRPGRPAPASAEMAERLDINRSGQLTPQQRRTALIAGLVTLTLLLCPLSMLVQFVWVLLAGSAPAATIAGLVFTALGVGFLVMFLGLIGSNVQRFLPEALGNQPVRYAQGPLIVLPAEGHRPELPFSYVVGDYSFAPYVAPADVEMRPGARYIIYYSRRSRLLLSMAALDAPDAAQWQPAFDNPPPFSWH